MLVGVIAIAASGCFFPAPSEIRGTDARFDAGKLEGRWFVVASNFPMWVDGARKDPVFDYRLLHDRDAIREVDDVVSWHEDGEPGRYLGIDTQDPHNGAHFTWRGKGALSLVSTEWYLAGLAPDGAWAIVYYQDTVASPEGVDIIARSRTLTPDRMDEAMAALRSDSVLGKKATGMKKVARTDSR